MKNFLGQRKFWIHLLTVLGVTIIFAIVINFLLSKFDIAIKSTTPYYLLSSIIQGFLAFIGILGAVTIFQLQETRERRRIAKKENGSEEYENLLEDEYWIRWRMMFLSFLVVIDILVSIVLLLFVKDGFVQESAFVLFLEAVVGFSITILMYGIWIVRKHFYWRERPADKVKRITEHEQTTEEPYPYDS